MSTETDTKLVHESSQQVADTPIILRPAVTLQKPEAALPDGFDQKLEELIQSIIVDPDVEVEEPPTVITVNQVPICTLGNFSVVIGKAKSMKTFLISFIAVAAALGKCIIDSVKGAIPYALEVHYFDTEQALHHLHKIVNRIASQIGNRPFTAYEMRSLPASTRMKIIEHVILKITKPSFIIIDGLRDLLSTGINNEEEATEVVSKLLRWTHDKNCHIMLVLHQNKNDQHARGHIGTEVVNKAETVLKLVKKGEITTVFPEFCRNIEFPPFSFSIDDDGNPMEEITSTENKQQLKKSKTEKAFQTILSGGTVMTHTELVKQYMKVEECSESTAKRRITDALDAEIILKNKEEQYLLNNADLHTEEGQ